jgi:hypothetical protein
MTDAVTYVLADHEKRLSGGVDWELQSVSGKEQKSLRTIKDAVYSAAAPYFWVAADLDTGTPTRVLSAVDYAGGNQVPCFTDFSGDDFEYDAVNKKIKTKAHAEVRQMVIDMLTKFCELNGADLPADWTSEE